jgi:hypothetical protein
MQPRIVGRKVSRSGHALVPKPQAAGHHFHLCSDAVAI